MFTTFATLSASSHPILSISGTMQLLFNLQFNDHSCAPTINPTDTQQQRVSYVHYTPNLL